MTQITITQETPSSNRNLGVIKFEQNQPRDEIIKHKLPKLTDTGHGFEEIRGFTTMQTNDISNPKLE